MGNPWDTGDSSLMNSDLTEALHRLFLLMTGYLPSEAQKIQLWCEGFPEALLYAAVIHLIEGRVIKSRVAELMPLDEFYYLKIVLWRISLTSAHRLFRVFDGIKTPGTMEFRVWQLIQNTVGGVPLPPLSQGSLDSRQRDEDSMSSSDSGTSSDSPLPSTSDTGIPADIKDQMSQYASDDSSASSSIQAFDRDLALQVSDQQRLDVNNPSAETAAADAQHVSGPVVQPTDETHARCITNGYLRMKHDRGQCNGIGMISRGSLNKSSLFRYFILYLV